MLKKILQAIGNTPDSSDFERSSTNLPENKKNKQHILIKEQKPSILIVSNNKKISNRLRLLLGDNFRIIERENLSMIFQLFASVKREHIDVVIYYDSDPQKDLSLISMMKKYPRFTNVPVIVLAEEINEKRKVHFLENDISDFIDMQSFPLIQQMVKSKIKIQSRINSIINYSIDHKSGLDVISLAHMQVRTLADVAGCARTLKQITNATLNQERAFFELILNSLEHGQLKINKKERLRTKESGEYESYLEILTNRNKEPIIITFEKCDQYYLINIIDGGDGFNYEKYLQTNSSESANESEKGIYIANNTKGINLSYNDVGNITQLKVNHKERYKLWH
ncbi:MULTISPECIES: hypothetical protein [Halobacteriovorax]|uniref:Response regulatory domain-containing protein n=1 Tax=Halobacteriovorax vibrionivorans TaxID=2152716 RepID=A0ABY0IEL7_9BACT|nr:MULTISPECIES: hypothetical protein [Halobacteriovorax]AYF45009.1 hypothetical protein BALOs_2010 [Halobacteriovorax sp. BALOs_7]RZF21072.1 hypothetical protein DAY19_13920 [Halobacteriovorax vibrionivorans]TGD47042.1 hypothetical protein EP118_09735 [Halobacteriovorax sp. Y22]